MNIGLTFFSKSVVIFFLFISINQLAFAQDDKALFFDKKEDIIKEKNGEFLFKWATDQKKQYRSERHEAFKFARKNNYPTFGEANGKTYTLQGFDDSGFLSYYIDNNAISASVINTDLVHPNGGAGLNLTGEGTVLSVWENSRPLSSHVELSGRVFQMDNSGRPFGDHATHVAGTMVAAGVNPAAKGMAYQAYLRAFDTEDDVPEMAAESAEGIQISNHSYGSWVGWDIANHAGPLSWHWFGDTGLSQTEDYKFGQYDVETRNWDIIVYNAPFYLPVKSAGNSLGFGPPSGTQHWVRNSSGQWVVSTTGRPANGGNDGFDCIPTVGNAKNILTVGSLTNEENGGWSVLGMSDFSSIGPTDDGRIKPDIVAMGDPVFSSISANNTAYDIKGGTSMAAPAVAGSMQLLLQHFINVSGGYTLRASALKALVIHTSDQFGASVAPTYTSGWGVMDTRAAADLITDSFEPNEKSFIRSRDSLFENSTRQYAFYHDGIGPFKATIAWTDVPGPVQGAVLNPTTTRLVNDLDVRLISIDDFTVYYPWRLNPSSPSAAATKGDNFRDNVEQVFEANPPKGDYVIQVSHKGSLYNGFQIFSTVVTGGEYLGIYRDRLEMATSINLQPNPVIQSENTTVTFNATNRGLSDFNGEISIDLHDGNGTYIEEIANKTGLSLCPGCSFQNNLQYNFTLDNPLGDYLIAVWYKPEGGNWDLMSDTNFDNFIEFELIDPPMILTASPTSFNVDASADQKSVNLTTNCDDWDVVNLPNWITANPSSGSDNATINLSILENMSIQSRSATFKIDGCGLSQNITVSQAGANAILTASPTNFNLPAQQGSGSFSITSNCTNWNITSDQTWLTASPASGSGNATISFNITENVGLQARSGTLTINGCGQTQVINVSQAGAATVLSVSPTFLNLSETQGNASFSITANCNWTITSIPNWMTVTPTMGNGNMLVNITYTENTSTQPRTATLTIIGCGTDQQLPITQTGCSLPPAPNLGQSGTITVCPNEPVPLTANACSGCIVVWSNNQTGNSITVTSEGTYQAYASNSCGQSQWSGSVTVEYYETPSLTTISATGPTDNLCNGETVQLTAGNVCVDCTVVWSDGQVGNPIMGMAGITYTAYVLENECELQSGNSNEIELTLASVPPVADIEPNGDQTICEGETVELTVQNVCTDCTVLWSTGSTEPAITVSSEGIYTATLLNKCDVQGLISDAVNVTITPAAPMAQVTPVGPIDGCIGQTITLTVSGCPTCNVQWSNNEAGPVMTTTISGAFTATYSNECGDALPSNEVVVNLTEYVPEITVNNECYLAAPNGSNHQWLFNGNPIATGQFFTAEETGYYSLAMTNNVGCTGTSEPLFIDGCATPVKEIGALTSLNVYPNPVESTAYFSLTLNQPLYLQIDLLTTDGRFLQNVFDDEMQTGETTVSTDVSKLSTGVYLFQIISENGVRMGRLVVTK